MAKHHDLSSKVMMFFIFIRIFFKDMLCGIMKTNGRKDEEDI